jgi:hypothetical protein
MLAPRSGPINHCREFKIASLIRMMGGTPAVVIAGLDPAIHRFEAEGFSRWMPGQARA